MIEILDLYNQKIQNMEKERLELYEKLAKLSPFSFFQKKQIISLIQKYDKAIYNGYINFYNMSQYEIKFNQNIKKS